MYEKEFIGLYISGISEKVKSISQFLFLLPNVSYMIHFRFCTWRALVADKTHIKQLVSTGMIYSNCITP